MATGKEPFDDYFKSTFEEKLMVKMPEKESDHLTPATRLLEKRREMTEVEQALLQQKEEYIMKMESLQQRREELDRKEQELKESLLKFDKFLKENDLKKARAKKKANAERDMEAQKTKEVERLTQRIEQLKKEVAKQKATLKRYKIYQTFMDKVLDHTDEFEEAGAIISRHETLYGTKEELMRAEQNSQDVIETERAGLAKYLEDKNNEILGYNNELARLQTKLDEVQITAIKWDSEWNRIQTTAARKTLLLGQIKMATHNLYMLMSKHLHKKVTSIDAEDTLSQLDKIHLFIKDLTEITNEIKRHETSMQPAHSKIL